MVNVAGRVLSDIVAINERILLFQNERCNCDHHKCSCRKHGLDSPVGCGECKCVGCSNFKNLPEVDITEDL
jgi:hypothetical protein